ncbi:serine carboxypeptidase-like 18 isoform X2 [Zingiber officinale]|uniref:serine carboxypeptidase-like 18 isoform X2 n=1 Tax=Zingiber officinale TaxID=94328 RepID=UPI001C4D52F1|nr:serine carboxypeptidase-like 18 isoform X2 [Zingiber officinale]
MFYSAPLYSGAKAAEVNKAATLDQMMPSLRSPSLNLIHLLRPCLLLCSLSSLSASVVTHLPGYEGTLPFHLETGYVSVDEQRGAELFYYFVRSEGEPEDDPLLLWLSGGPGCSSFSALAFEVGPVTFTTKEYDGNLPKLEQRTYAWTKIANIIFVDSPVGTGFSFIENPVAYDVGERTSIAYLYDFLIKWLIDRPQFLSCPLYIVGESHAGKIAPAVAQLIAEGISSGKQPLLNLKGYLLGNPFTGESIDINSRVPFAHGMGIISDEFYEMSQKNCQGQDHRYPTTAGCATNIKTFEEICTEISMFYISDPLCGDDSPTQLSVSKNTRSLLEEHMGLLNPPSPPDFICRSYAYYLSYFWANNNLTQEALHVKKGTVAEWFRCNHYLRYNLFKYDLPSSLQYHLNLTRAGYRALVFSGDHDMYVPFLGTYAWIKSLSYPVVEEWRSWHVGGQVAGYTKLYSNNLTFATIKGAGHEACSYKPKECFAMFQRWISDQSL